MNSPIVLHLDKSSPWNLCLERDGRPVPIEEAFEQGFFVSPADANALLTMAQTLTKTRDVYAQ